MAHMKILDALNVTHNISAPFDTPFLNKFRKTAQKKVKKKNIILGIFLFGQKQFAASDPSNLTQL